MKKIFTLLLTALICVSASAQLQKGGEVRFSPVKANKAPMKAQSTKVFSYNTTGKLSYLGIQAAETYDLAIFVPERFAGKRIDKIEFLLYDKSCLKDVKAWVATNMPQDVANAAVCVNVPINTVKDVENDGAYTSVTLTQDFIVPEGGCLVGYSFTVTSIATNPGKYPILTDGGTDINGAFFVRTSSTIAQWGNLSGAGYGNLCTVVTLTGDYPDNNVMTDVYSVPVCVKSNDKFDARMALFNNGTSPVTSVEVVVKDVTNDVALPAQTLNVNIPVDNTVVASVEIPTPEALNLHQTYSFTVTKVNGEDNTAGREASAEFSLANAAEVADVYVVEEEMTGTGCGWCPRGITGMKMAKEKFGDRFIPVAIHCYNTSDPMYSSVYSTFASNTFPGAPSCVLNRGEAMDPYYGTSDDDFGIANDIEALISNGSYAKVGVEAYWADADSLLVNVRSTHEFYVPFETADYGVAYVLVADSLVTPPTATTTTQKNKWKQSNYYNQYTAAQVGPDLAPWTQKGSTFVTPFGHVAIAVKNILTGNKDVITAPVSVGQVYEDAVTFDMSTIVLMYQRTTGKRLQDFNKVSVVAMLIDNNTGAVINAKSTPVMADPAAIRDITVGAQKANVSGSYNLAGQKVSSDFRGVVIMNGKKVLVK